MEGERMLVLTRKVGEAVSIGDSILIKIVEIKEGYVRIGIEAPTDLRILRGGDQGEGAEREQDRRGVGSHGLQQGR